MRIFLLLLVLLTGCAGAPAVIKPDVNQMSKPFSFNGRVALRQGSMRDGSGIRWEHRNHDEIFLLGPLGYTVARIHLDAEGATLLAQGQLHSAPDAEALMQKAVGWSLPLSGLTYWVAAAPAPLGEARVERNAEGQISVLYQQGWEIHYSRYTSHKADALPLQLNLRHDDLEVTLLIDEWEAQ